MKTRREELFDNWAEEYDASVQGADTFLFAGYEEVLQEIVRRAAFEPEREDQDEGERRDRLAGRAGRVEFPLLPSKFEDIVETLQILVVPQLRGFEERFDIFKQRLILPGF